MTSSRTTTYPAALRLFGVTLALALLVAVVPASSKADPGDASRRATATTAAPAARNAAKIGRATSGGFRSPSELRAAVAGGGTVRVIVGYDSEFTPEGDLSAAQASAQRAGIKRGRQALLAAVSGTRHKVVRKFSTIPYVAMEVSAAALARLEASGAVTSITEDVALPPTLAESVPLIQGDDMWAAGYDGTGQTVAVLDTGVDSAHSFLAGKVVSEACFSGNSDCPNGLMEQVGAGSGAPCAYEPDACKHGTHVSGIAAGTSGSFSGVGKSADVVAIQVFSEFTGADCVDGAPNCALSYTSDQIAGLEHVLDLSDTIDIASANLSLGGGEFFFTCDYYDPAYQVIIAQLRSLGIATVIATGNAGLLDAMGFPACLPNAISVSSTEKDDSVSSFSNNAYFTSLMAPGGLINSSTPGGTFEVFNGTSMATPHVAGAWALLHDAQPASVFETLRALQETGVPIADVNATIPRINIFDAAGMLVAGTAPGLQITGVRDSPDPFTPKASTKKKTKIYWDLSHYSISTTVKIQTKSGKLVKTLVNRDLGMGPWFVAWNGKDKNGNLAKAGTYKYVISVMNDDGEVVKKSGTVQLKR